MKSPMKIARNAQVRIRLMSLMASLVMVGANPVCAQVAAKIPGGNGSSGAVMYSTPSTPFAIEKSDLLNNLDEVRRQYPKLYERLRRERGNAELGGTASANTADLSAPVPIEVLLRQDVTVGGNKTVTKPLK